jgi:hypothetical protein
MINAQIVQFYALFHLPLSDLRCDEYSLNRCEVKPYMKEKSRVFDHNSTNIGQIAYLKAGGERAHRTAQFTY